MNANIPTELISARQLSRQLGRSESFLGSRIEAGEIEPDFIVKCGTGRAPIPVFRKERFPEIEALAAGRSLPPVPSPSPIAA